MKIKEINLCNFRSFKNEHKITSISPNTTIVVGKNGSGKSNILEAIRFIMPKDGRTSPEERKMFIYEGGVEDQTTYVEILFENSDNRFPADAEFTIKRTIDERKDVISIDGRTVTKEELNNLFESAGFLRSNPYYLVPQGAVEQLAIMDEKQRHEFIKDIAGATIYEKDRENFVLQMKDATEIEERIIALNKRLTKRIELLKIDRVKLNELEKIDEERNAIEKIMAERELAELSKKFNDEQEKFTEEIDESEDCLDRLEVERIMLVEKVGGKKIEEIKKGVNNEMEEMKNKVKKSEEVVKRLTEEYENTDIEATAKKYEKAFLETSQKEKYTDEDIKETVEKIAVFEKNLHSKENEGERKQLFDEEKYKNMILKRKTLWIEQKTNETMIKKTNEDIKVSERNTIGSFGSCFKTISDIKKETGVLGCVYELIQIPAQLFLAASSVIGSHLYSIVVETDINATNIIKKIDRRITFIPLNRIEANNEEDISNEEMIPLYKNIKTDPKFYNILKFVTRNTYLVADIKSATILLKKYSVNMVTMDGECISKGGVISGGYEAKKNSLIEYSNLKEKITNLEKRSVEIKQEISECDEFINNMSKLKGLNFDNNKSIKTQILFYRRKLEYMKNWPLKNIYKHIDRLERDKTALEIKKERIEIEKNRIVNEKIQAEIKLNSLEKEILKEKKVENMNEEIKRLDFVIKEIERIRERSENKRNSAQSLEIDKKMLLKSVIIEKCSELKVKINSLQKLRNDVVKKFVNLPDSSLIETIKDLNIKRRSYESCNPKSSSLLKELETQRDTLKIKIEEMLASKNCISEFILDLDRRKDSAINLTFNMICDNFSFFFSKLYPGKEAKLVKKNNTVVIELKNEGLVSTKDLSGGQKTVIALSLLFSIQKIDPSSFYVFDEIDASLDVQTRFHLCEIIKEFGTEFNSQFIMTTFKSEILECADKYIGVSFVDKVSCSKEISKDEAFGFLGDDDMQ